MSTIEAGPRPLRVSPLIKFARWSFLLTGILYGMYHYRRFSKIENARREKELREKPMRDAQLAAEKARKQQEEQQMLADIFKVT
ncbi:ATP synthase, subunit E [Ptiloglossa arizonensis]|uniref:ATP synthase, subunit E n=1 Tax=Ptiloglossa arizonensis TaxID=3350558 RepID=UPI003FA0A81D